MVTSFIRRKIAPLPEAVASRIAAGEVVERPVSIVKELIENSLDSGADSIILEIKNGGKSYIRVSDNGCGIPSDEVEIAFLRHATSKISDDKDLLSIETLGFRGEALASISAVTRTTMITRTAGESSGIRISVEGGKIVEKSPVGAAEGTTIIVSDLFYNTPVREKFMKKDSTETALVGDYISRMSLAYPTVRFKFINNEKIIFSTNGKGSVIENIFTVFGKETAENLIEINREENGVSLYAYISNPLFTKNSRKNQYYFVNGRVVSDKVLEDGLTRGYGDKTPEGRFPVAFVFVKINSDRVDVNIHPNKKEVRFDNPAEIRHLLEYAVFNGLNAREAVGNISPIIENKNKSNDSIIDLSDDKPTNGKRFDAGRNIFKYRHSDENKSVSKVNESKDSWQTVLQTTFGNKSEKVNHNIYSVNSSEVDSVVDERMVDNNSFSVNKNKTDSTLESNVVDENKSSVNFKEESDISPLNLVDNNHYSVNQNQKKANDNNSGLVDDNQNSLKPSSEAESDAFDIASLKVLGVLFDTFIAASDYNTFYLIDQHAAHERVFYEKFLKEFYSKTAASQIILTPIIKDIPYYAREGEGGWPSFLKNAGFELEPFGENAFIFRAIPSYMSLSQAEGFLDDYIDNINNSTNFKDKSTIDRIIMRSCKSAVKAHDRLTAEEIRALLKELSRCKNPYSCPHGRPTIVKMTENDMKKLFKRM